MRQSSATIKLGPEPWLPLYSTEASSRLSRRMRYVARPPRKRRCLTAPEARSRRRSGRVRTVVRLSVSASQSASSPAATQPGCAGVRNVAATPRVVTFAFESWVASRMDPATAAATERRITPGRKRWVTGS